jgi:RimJ/RimL family protein N-acetyltransferase
MMCLTLLRGIRALTLLFLLFALRANAQQPWLPTEFIVPERYVFAEFLLTKVDPALAENDHQALLQARQQIRRDLASEWPEDGLTVAANRESLENDLQSFSKRQAFTYHLLELKTGRIVGCVYLSPSNTAQYQAVLYYWLLPSYYQSANHSQIRQQIYDWIKKEWPFNSVDVSLNAALSV